MALTVPSAKNGGFKIQIVPSIIDSVVEPITINMPFNFAGLTFVKSATGTYTPADDTLQVITFDSGTQPMWMIVLVDKSMNWFMTNNAAGTEVFSTSKLHFHTRVNPVNGYIGLFLDGRNNNTLNVSGKMVQGQAVNYAIYWGNGS